MWAPTIEISDVGHSAPFQPEPQGGTGSSKEKGSGKHVAVVLLPQNTHIGKK